RTHPSATTSLTPSSLSISCPGPPSPYPAAATTDLYTLSLHAALPISADVISRLHRLGLHHIKQFMSMPRATLRRRFGTGLLQQRSEEHTSELQSRENLVCRLLLEKKKAEGQRTKAEEHFLPAPKRGRQ